MRYIVTKKKNIVCVVSNKKAAEIMVLVDCYPYTFDDCGALGAGGFYQISARLLRDEKLTPEQMMENHRERKLERNGYSNTMWKIEPKSELDRKTLLALYSTSKDAWERLLADEEECTDGYWAYQIKSAQLGESTY